MPAAPSGNQYKSTPAMLGRVRYRARMADLGFADEFLPVYDVSNAVAVVADTDRETVWRALLDVDLLSGGREVPLAGILGALRMLPEIVGHLLHGERPAKPPESMRLRDLPSIPMYEGGWILLDSARRAAEGQHDGRARRA
jgi:hypothetical protein